MTKFVGWLLLFGAGMLSLPIVAYFLDDQGTENLIVPVQLAAMATLGAVVAVSVPGLATGSLNRRVTLGAVYGVFAALVGVVVFYVLLSGLRGA